MQASGDQRTLAFALPDFAALSESERAALLRQGEFLRLSPGQLLYRENREDDNVHYLLEGTLSLSWKGRAIRTLDSRPPAQCEALDSAGRKLYTVHARSPSLVLKMPRITMEQVLQAEGKKPIREAVASDFASGADRSQSWMVLLLRSDIFARLPAANLQKVFDKIESIALSPGEDVVRRGDPPDYYYVVESGSCEIWRPGQGGAPATHVADLSTGGGFAEEALIEDKPHSATLRMRSAGRLLRLRKHDFDTLILQALINKVSLAEAKHIAERAGTWLDTREPGSTPFDLCPEPQSLPLPMLRNARDDLATGSHFIVIAENEGEAAIGAFWLAERGRKASYLAGGQTGLSLKSTVSAPPRLESERPWSAWNTDLINHTANLQQEVATLASPAKHTVGPPELSEPDLTVVDSLQADRAPADGSPMNAAQSLQPAQNRPDTKSPRSPHQTQSGQSYPSAIGKYLNRTGVPASGAPASSPLTAVKTAGLASYSTDIVAPGDGSAHIQRGSTIMIDDKYLNERNRSADPLGETVIGNSLAGLIDEMQGQLDSLPVVDPTPVEPPHMPRDSIAGRIAEKGDSNLDGVAEQTVDVALANAEIDLGGDPQLDDKEVFKVMEQHIAAQCGEFEKRVRETVKTTQKLLKAQYEKAFRARLNQIRAQAVQSLKRELAAAKSAYALQTAQERQAVRRDYQRLLTLANRIARQKAGINRARGQFEEKLQAAERLQREIFQLREMLNQQLGDLDGIEQEQSIETVEIGKSAAVGNERDHEASPATDGRFLNDGPITDTLEQTEARIRDALDRFNSA